MWSSRPSKFLLTSSIIDIIFVILNSTLGLVTPSPLEDVLLILAVTFIFTAVFDHVKNISLP